MTKDERECAGNLCVRENFQDQVEARGFRGSCQFSHRQLGRPGKVMLLGVNLFDPRADTRDTGAVQSSAALKFFMAGEQTHPLDVSSERGWRILPRCGLILRDPWGRH